MYNGRCLEHVLKERIINKTSQLLSPSYSSLRSSEGDSAVLVDSPAPSPPVSSGASVRGGVPGPSAGGSV
jgi:hypothetical protein